MLTPKYSLKSAKYTEAYSAKRELTASCYPTTNAETGLEEQGVHVDLQVVEDPKTRELRLERVDISDRLKQI